MNDLYLFGAFLACGVFYVGYWAFVDWRETRRLIFLNKQIREGIVPTDYSKKIKAVARQQNADFGGPTDALGALRYKVSCIRVEGFDRARVAKNRGELFIDGIESNPYPKGSGEAQQWARGYCQEGCHPPKGWMQIA